MNASIGEVEFITAPATPEAKQWEGWGTALKPAWEPIIVARKPLTGTVAENVLQRGTGGINIDGCRVGTTKRVPSSVSRTDGQIYNGGWGQEDGSESGHNPNIGRWPANLIHDGSEEVVGLFPANANPDKRTIKFAKNGRGSSSIYGDFGSTLINGPAYGDTGSAARFFYCAKASKSERGEGNTHPTVKPLALMKYLITLGLPPDGTVLDPFCGSGTTALACKELGRNYICIEKELEYYQIACNRLDQPIEPIPDEPIEEIIDNSPLQLKLF
jgi:site-specific DNA-methyltransferase (adenine-specific)